MKSHHNPRKTNLSNIEVKRNLEERAKKKMKENKEKSSIKEKRHNGENGIMEIKINYGKNSIIINRTTFGNNLNLMKNMKLNNRHINNSEYLKKEKYKNNMNRTTFNNSKNLITKKVITNKNMKSNNNIKYQTIHYTYVSKQKQNINKYMSKTIDIDEKEIINPKDDLNTENNFNCAINNNILCLINSNNDNILGNFGFDNLNDKKALNKHNSSSKIYSSPNKEIRIVNYNQINNNINGKGIFTNKTKIKNKRSSKVIFDNGHNYIYKKTARNNSCFKRQKYYKNMGFDFNNEYKENIVNENLNPQLYPYCQKKNYSVYIEKENYGKIKQDENENILLPINENYNRKTSSQNYYIYQTGINSNKSFVNKSNDSNKIYKKIRTKKMIKSSLRKRRETNSFAHNTNVISDLTELNNTDKNSQTIIMQKDLDDIENYNLNEDINYKHKNFNKTSNYIYQNNKKINESLNNIPMDIKDSTKRKGQIYFYSDKKTLEMLYNKNDENKDSNKILKDNKKMSPPILLHMNSPIYINKINNIPKTNNEIYRKKNIRDKKLDFKSLKLKTLKQEKSINSSIDSNKNNTNRDKNNEYKLSEFEFDDSIFDNINETINNNHCFQKKLYNYYIHKKLQKPYYLERIATKKIKKKKICEQK